MKLTFCWGWELSSSEKGWNLQYKPGLRKISGIRVLGVRHVTRVCLQRDPKRLLTHCHYVAAILSSREVGVPAFVA